jgi:hypothetical protein
MIVLSFVNVNTFYAQTVSVDKECVSYVRVKNKLRIQ